MPLIQIYASALVQWRDLRSAINRREGIAALTVPERVLIRNHFHRSSLRQNHFPEDMQDDLLEKHVAASAPVAICEWRTDCHDMSGGSCACGARLVSNEIENFCA
jgi:hypothetical protein